MKSFHWLGVLLLGGALALPAAAQKSPVDQPAPAKPAAAKPVAERLTERQDKRAEKREQRGEQKDAAPGERKEGREEARAEREEKREEALEARQERIEERLDEIRGTLDERRVKLAERLKKMHETRATRAAAERRHLMAHYGEVKDNPALANELRHHAWRMAKLHRMLLLATSEGRDALRPRIEQLIGKEMARHAKAMERFPKPAPAASGSTGKEPTRPEKGMEKLHQPGPAASAARGGMR